MLHLGMVTMFVMVSHVKIECQDVNQHCWLKTSSKLFRQCILLSVQNYLDTFLFTKQFSYPWDKIINLYKFIPL